MFNWVRKNIGAIVATIGLLLMAILTFGDIGELFTEQYWINVGGNLSSIGALTIGLTLVQVSIKQGVSEQALSKGLNTENTKKKYDEHKGWLTKCRPKQIYLPYFLGLRNKRETKRRRQEFLQDNRFLTEEALYASGNKKLIRAYEKIYTNITSDSIKWSTTEIIYNKNGRIEKLDAYRRKRAIKATIMAFVFMLGMTLITGGLFLSVNEVPIWQKVVKFFTYLITMAITVVFDIGKNYEKGAYGVPNELDEVNTIWEEFDKWEVPNWVIKEVEELNSPQNELEQKTITKEKDYGTTILLDYKKEEQTTINTGTVVQEESEEIKII